MAAHLKISPRFSHPFLEQLPCSFLQPAPIEITCHRCRNRKWESSAPRSVRRRSFSVGRLARVRRRGGVLARVWTIGPPGSGMEIPHRSARTQRIHVSYLVDVHCAPRSQCVGGPERASARGQRPHPLDVQRQAHEVPLAVHLRQAAQAESSESEHLLDPPVRRLREPLALRVPGLARERLASFSPMRCVAHIGCEGGIEHVPSVSTNIQSSRSSVVIPAMVWSPWWRRCTVSLRCWQPAANRLAPEEDTEMATARDGWDDVSREYPEVFHQAAEALEAWSQTAVERGDGLVVRDGLARGRDDFAAWGIRRGCRRGDANQRAGWTCHDEHWSESACATLTVRSRASGEFDVGNLYKTE